MPHATEAGESQVDDLARRSAVGVRDEADAARIALGVEIVKKNSWARHRADRPSGSKETGVISASSFCG
jgi:hypothetical protein